MRTHGLTRQKNCTNKQQSELASLFQTQKLPQIQIKNPMTKITSRAAPNNDFTTGTKRNNQANK